MTGKRMVVIDINTICNLFRDYCGEVGFPKSGKPIKFMFHPTDRKLAVIVESDEWAGGQPVEVEEVRFDIQRMWSVGG